MRKNHLADTKELQAYFVNRVYKMVKKQGKKMIGWDELFTKDLPKDVTVQVWSPFAPPALVQNIASQGNPVILSKGYYLDHFMPAYIHYGLEFPNADILGAEAAQWTELADAENLETRIWPRMAMAPPCNSRRLRRPAASSLVGVAMRAERRTRPRSWSMVRRA